MNQWAANHPEEYAEIAALPPSQQNAALRAAIGYDPDCIRDQHKEADNNFAPARSMVPPIGSASRGGESCGACGAPAGVKCASVCEANR